MIKPVLSFLTGHINPKMVDMKLREPIRDAFKSEDCFKDVPNVPGIYIMVSKTVKYTYPKKNSPVLYIGTSKHLRSRLNEHYKCYIDAKKDFKKHMTWQYCRYNYAVAFGVDIYYMRITGCEKEKLLESKAIEGFYDKYGAIPVGNGAISYR